VNEVMINAGALEVGMYVSRLDRPWIETPFALQGMRIRNRQDVERLSRYCNYVFVDVDRGVRPNKSRDDARAKLQPKKKGEAENEYLKLRKRNYESSVEFSKELPEAQKLFAEFSSGVTSVMTDLGQGKRVDVAALRDSVGAMLESVQRNPQAFLWINRVKKADSYTYRHLIGTAVWCGVFGRHLGLEQDELEDLTLGGLLLDVGKSKLPRELLEKTDTLTDAEFVVLKTHVEHSVRILSGNGRVSNRVMRMVASHHERWNGSGYPLGLTGTEIPVYGRIGGLIDSFEAMTSPRPFHPGISPHEAISQLYDYRGELFQTELVEQFIQSCGVYPTGSLVELTTGEVAAVIGLNGTRRLRPKIMLLLDPEKQPYDDYITVDLASERSEVAVRKGLPPGAFGIDMENLFL